jgi:hypothetical protein
MSPLLTNINRETVSDTMLGVQGITQQMYNDLGLNDIVTTVNSHTTALGIDAQSTTTVNDRLLINESQLSIDNEDNPWYVPLSIRDTSDEDYYYRAIDRMFKTYGFSKEFVKWKKFTDKNFKALVASLRITDSGDDNIQDGIINQVDKSEIKNLIITLLNEYGDMSYSQDDYVERVKKNIKLQSFINTFLRE